MSCRTEHTYNCDSALFKKLCVVIPTYNNAGTVADVIMRTYSYCSNIIVVNDGSTDNTLDKIGELSVPLVLVNYKVNRGKGYALIQGFKKALSLGWDYAITIDSDGQHYPEDIPALVEAEIANPNSIIVGSRVLENKEISKGSLFANKFSNFWVWFQTGYNLSDTQTGFRLYPLKKLPCFGLITSRYESEIELLVLAAWRGTKINEVPINVYYPSKEERVSHFRPCRDFIRITILNTLLSFGALLYGYPRKILLYIRSILYTVFSFLFFLVAAFLISISAIVYLKLLGTTDIKKERYHAFLNRVARFVVRNIPGTSFIFDNSVNEDFVKPAVIISNHQSHLDLMCAMMLTPKLIILTKKWVWNNPFYGVIIRLADFYPITDGYEKTIEYLKPMVEKGYSVLVYPEGTRSADCSILHFNKGAFFMAEELKLDILPVIEYGPGKVLPKTGFRLRPHKICVKVMERVKLNDTSFGETFRAKAKNFEKYYKQEYKRLAHYIDFM